MSKIRKIRKTTRSATRELYRVASSLLLVLTLVSPHYANATLVSATLPGSRSVELNKPATVFATVINTASSEATDCRFYPDPNSAATLEFATTNPVTNATEGMPNVEVSIAAGATQTFVLSVQSSTAIAPTTYEPQFVCSNASTTIVEGINTFVFSASEEPTPDVIALNRTLSADSVVTLPQRSSVAAFVVSSINLGAPDTLTVLAESSLSGLPLTLTVCETNPQTSACVQPVVPSPAPLVLPMGTNASKTLGVFIDASDDIAFDPANARIKVSFKDSDGNLRGATSVAVRSRLRAPSEPLQLLPSIATHAVRQPLQLSSSLLQLQQIALAGITRLAQSGAAAEVVECEAGGVAWTLIDTDQNRIMSVGDTLAGAMVVCSMADTQVESGRIDVRITDFLPRGETWQVAGRASLTDVVASSGGLSGTLEGGFAFTFQQGVDASETQTSINRIHQHPSQPFIVQQGELDVKAAQFDLHISSADDHLDLEYTASLESSALHGAINCIVERARAEINDSSPISGELVCFGLHDDKLTLESRGSELNDFGALRLNQSGELSVIAESIAWFDLGGETLLASPFGDFLFAPLALELPVAQQIELDVGALTYNKFRDELYAGSGTALLIIDAETLTTLASIPTSGQISTIALSREGNTAFLGYADRSEIQSVNLSNRTFSLTLPLGADQNGEALYAEDIEADPAGSSRIVVSLRRDTQIRRQAGVIAFEGSFRLPLEIVDPESGSSTQNGPRANKLVFNNDGNLFGLSTETNEAEVYRLSITSDGVAEGTYLRRFMESGSKDIIAVENDLIAAAQIPTVVDFSAQRVKAKLVNPKQQASSLVIADNTARKIFVVGPDVHVYALDSFQTLSNNRTTLGTDLVGIALTPTKLVVAERTQITAFNRTDIANSLNPQCAPQVDNAIIKLPCSIADATYSGSTDEFLVALPAQAGVNGNTIARLNPESGIATAFVRVASEPEQIALSNNGQFLYVAHSGSNQTTEIDLTSGTSSESDLLLQFGRNNDFAEPLFVKRLATSPGTQKNLLVETDAATSIDRIALILDGKPLYQQKTFFHSVFRKIHYSSNDPSLAFGINSSGLHRIILGPEGATNIDRIDTQVKGTFAAADNQLFSSNGYIVNQQTLQKSQPFGELDAAAVAFDPVSGHVLYMRHTGELLVYSMNSAELLSTIRLQGAENSQITSMAVSPVGVLVGSVDSGGWLIPTSVLLER